MIKKIKTIKQLEKELYEQHNIGNVAYHVDEDTIEVLVLDIDNFLKIIGKAPVITEVVNYSETHPYLITSKKEGIEFNIFLTEEEYKEYEKSRAQNTTKKE